MIYLLFTIYIAMDQLNLTDLRNECLASLYSCTENIAYYLENENDRVNEFNKLRDCVIKYCNMEIQEEAGMKAIQLLEEESVDGNWDSLQNQYEDKSAQCTKQPKNFDKHRFVKELEKHIKTAEKNRRECTSRVGSSGHRTDRADYIQAGGDVNHEQDSEVDLAITEATETYIDPFSKRPINNPMRNKICNHVYDKETIESIVRNKRNKGCPCVGCTNKQVMLAQHLEPDEELLLTIRRTQRSTQSSEEM